MGEGFRRGLPPMSHPNPAPRARQTADAKCLAPHRRGPGHATRRSAFSKQARKQVLNTEKAGGGMEIIE
jgi:hypothetical protein